MLPETALPTVRPARLQEAPLRAAAVTRAEPLHDHDTEPRFSPHLDQRPASRQKQDQGTPPERVTETRTTSPDALAVKPVDAGPAGIGGGLVLPTALFIDELAALEPAEARTQSEATPIAPIPCCDLPPPLASVLAAPPLALPLASGAPVPDMQALGAPAPAAPALPQERAAQAVDSVARPAVNLQTAGPASPDKVLPPAQLPASQPEPKPAQTQAEPSPPIPAHAPVLTVGVAPPMQNAATPAAPLPAAAPAPLPLAALPMTIAAQAIAGEQRFDIRLDPAELGRVEVTLAVDREGGVRTHLVVERPETLHLLRNDLNRLEQALAETGLKSDPGGISFSLKQGGEGGRQPGTQAGQASGQAPAADADTLPAAPPPRLLRGLGSGVDLIL